MFRLHLEAKQISKYGADNIQQALLLTGLGHYMRFRLLSMGNHAPLFGPYNFHIHTKKKLQKLRKFKKRRQLNLRGEERVHSVPVALVIVFIEVITRATWLGNVGGRFRYLTRRRFTY